jgi:hypothetical protein
MGDTITRKCACCKNEIVIDVDDVRDVVYFEGLYYHSTCFKEMATRKATSKRGKPQKWQDALDRLWELEADSKKMLEYRMTQDELNEWLLKHYDIIEVPKRFWQVVADLGAGKYKQRKCKPVSIQTLCGCWKWGQHKLDEIYRNNKMYNKGPTDGSARLSYDLAVLVGKVPQFIAHQEKQKTARNEMSRTFIYNDNIDMSRIGQGKQIRKKDISDISDDIFTE